MKKKHRIIMGVLVTIVALGTIISIVIPQSLITPAVSPIDVTPRNDLADPNTEATSTVAKDYSDLIVVTTPSKGATVTSPLTIKGKARGPWYFEASFPVQLIDDDTGLEIAHGIAEAQGDWMTDNFVPFISTLTFTKQPTSTSAKLILRKDNPSGLPENDASIEIPLVVK